MDRRTFLKTVPAVTVLAATGRAFAQETAPTSSRSETPGTAPSSAPAPEAITLLKPQADGGKSVLAALWERRTIRNISPEKLPAQMLSDLLWAAFGINRADSGRRTAPSAMNWQEIDVYVATAGGLFVYDAKANALKRVHASRGVATITIGRPESPGRLWTLLRRPRKVRR